MHIGSSILTRDTFRDIWLRWSPYELSFGRGSAVDSGMISSETHPTPSQVDLTLHVYTKDYNWFYVTVH